MRRYLVHMLPNYQYKCLYQQNTIHSHLRLYWTIFDVHLTLMWTQLWNFYWHIGGHLPCSSQNYLWRDCFQELPNTLCQIWKHAGCIGNIWHLHHSDAIQGWEQCRQRPSCLWTCFILSKLTQHLIVWSHPRNPEHDYFQKCWIQSVTQRLFNWKQI